jgi:hypothetical protein
MILGMELRRRFRLMGGVRRGIIEGLLFSLIRYIYMCLLILFRLGYMSKIFIKRKINIMEISIKNPVLDKFLCKIRDP